MKSRSGEKLAKGSSMKNKGKKIIIIIIHTLEVAFNAWRGNAFRNNSSTALNSPGDKYCCRILAEFCCDFLDFGIIHDTGGVSTCLESRQTGNRHHTGEHWWCYFPEDYKQQQGFSSFSHISKVLVQNIRCHPLTLSSMNFISSGCWRKGCASIWFTTGGMVAVLRSSCVFAMVKLLIPMLRTLPALTSLSIAAHVSAIGTPSERRTRLVTGSRGRNISSPEYSKQRGQWTWCTPSVPCSCPLL